MLKVFICCSYKRTKNTTDTTRGRKMTNDQINTAAIAAIRAMSTEARAEFIRMYESGDNAQTVAQAYAVEGVSRQVRMASMALESARTMSALVDAVEATI